MEEADGKNEKKERTEEEARKNGHRIEAEDKIEDKEKCKKGPGWRLQDRRIDQNYKENR
jgi:hypothetical protein